LISIRRATAKDESNVRALLRLLLTDILINGETVDKAEAAGSTYRDLLTAERGTIIIAEDETGFLGCITFSYNLAIRYGGEYAQIEELIVNDSARGKKVGAALVQGSIDAARSRGCKEIGLYAMEHNVPFYEKQGFSYIAPELRQRID
jgi:predicted N-acetyltransferase YhbS